MMPPPHPQHRTVTVTRNRNRTRRHSACHRHPSEPVTGFCALCLRDRLAGLDSASGQIEAQKTVVTSRRTRGHAAVAPATALVIAPAPELRRSKSVAAENRDDLNGVVMDLRRRSCDVRARSSLSDLFGVESVKLGFPSAVETAEDDGDDSGHEIRVSDEVCEQNEGEIEEEKEKGDLKTMKEIIEIELQNKRRNFWEAASVFSQKLRNWRQKQKDKKLNRSINGEIDLKKSKLGQLGSQLGGQIRDTQSEVADYGLGRRSCDTEPRFSIDTHRLSIEDPRFSFDEHRASWDGYMITKTTPRLTPMLSVVDNMILGHVNKIESLQMHSISEDGVSGSGQSNSDCSTSNRGSSSSSSTKTVGLGLGFEDVKSVSNARVSPANDVMFQGTKLVITEKELKDWHLNSVKNNAIESESVSNGSNPSVLASKTNVTNASNVHKKVVSSSWKKVCNLWGRSEKKNTEKANTSVNHVRKPNVSSRSRIEHNCRDLVLDRNRSTRYSTSDIDSGLLRLYLTPFRNTRRGKSGINKLHIPSMATNGLQLN